MTQQSATLARLFRVLDSAGFKESAPGRWSNGPFKVTVRTRGAWVGVNLYNRPDGRGSQWCDSWWLETPGDADRVAERLGRAV
jgi:hypothetical protein